jgi:hypothetical protein
MTTALSLLKNYETFILELKYEDLLHFLINDLIKSGFFLNHNYSKFINLTNSLKLKKELINNLENEHIQEWKIKEMEEKTKLILVTEDNTNKNK